MSARPQSEEYRAYGYLREVRPHWLIYTVPDNRHAPHICQGELAVIDTAPSFVRPFKIDLGEVYLIEYPNAYVLWQVNRWRMGNGNGDCYALQPLCRPPARADLDRWMSDNHRSPLTEGPVPLDYLRLNAVGKMIGLHPALTVKKRPDLRAV